MALQAGCSSVRRDLEGAALVSQGIRRISPESLLAAAEHAAAQSEGDFVLIGVGDSMRPHYGPGTALVVHPTSFFMLRAGMPVVYENRSGRRVAHVIVARSGRGWRARGTAGSTEDRDLVTPENLLGVVRCAFVPDAGPGDRSRLAGW